MGKPDETGEVSSNGRGIRTHAEMASAGLTEYSKVKLCLSLLVSARKIRAFSVLAKVLT